MRQPPQAKPVRRDDLKPDPSARPAPRQPGGGSIAASGTLEQCQRQCGQDYHCWINCRMRP